jgi:uncharacterized protein YcbX
MTRATGTVIRLWRYPVKSMLGEACARLDLDERGVVGDRAFAVRDVDGRLGSGKTTRRFRKIDDLLSFSAAQDHDVARITFPDGRAMRADDAHVHAALSDALGQPVTLTREAAVSHLDVGPLHLLTTASLARLKAQAPDLAADDRRFRPNVLIDVPGNVQVERQWIGETLRVGNDVGLRVSDATERCVMVCRAPST